MGNDSKLRSIIQSYKHGDDKVAIRPNDRITKKSQKKETDSKQELTLVEYKDLQPSLTDDLTLLFIGYNPGIQSSLQQHHYAHFTNLFWRLFNESQILVKVLKALAINIDQEIKRDELLKELIKINNSEMKTLAMPRHDFDLVKYKIGFTDLVLRCTKSAQELTVSEKLENVPRLIKEFKQTNSKFIVFVGKGVWEIVINYLMKVVGIRKFKLTTENFKWGKQYSPKDKTYTVLLKKFAQLMEIDCSIYVFPNTSGLVTALSYHEKLQLWNDLGGAILERTMYKSFESDL